MYVLYAYFIDPGVLHQVLVTAENEVGSGPAFTQEFYTKELSERLFIADYVILLIPLNR